MSTETSQLVITILIIVLIVAAIAVVGFFVYRSYRKRHDPVYADRIVRKKVYKESISPSQQRLKRAQKDYDRRLQARADDIRAAEVAREKAIRQQERDMKAIEDQYAEQITTFQGIRLYRDRVEAKGKSIRLNAQMKATVLSGREYLDAADVARENAKREAELSLDEDGTEQKVGTARVVEQQQTPVAFLVIHDGEDPAAADVRMSLESKEIDDAQSFANTFNCAATDIDKMREQRTAALDAAKVKLQAIKDDKSAIEAAQAAYETEVNVRGELDKAQKAFDETEYEARKQRDGLR